MTNYEYIKINDEPIEIEYIEDEHDETRDFEPSFWVNNRRYYLNDFLRTHNNPWIGGDFPEYIHGVKADAYYHPIYIELIGSDAVNVYEYKEV